MRGVTRQYNFRSICVSAFSGLSCSGVRQHALLNLSRMHYLRHEHSAARKVVVVIGHFSQPP